MTRPNFVVLYGDRLMDDLLRRAAGADTLRPPAVAPWQPGAPGLELDVAVGGAKRRIGFNLTKE